MKKQDFAKLALMGLASGLFVNGQLTANDKIEDSAEELPLKLDVSKHNSFLAVATAKNANKNSTTTTKTTTKTTTDNSNDDPNNGNLGYHLLTEDELLLELNDEATKQYNALSPEGKALAREVASQRCNGTNECKGLNACQTEHNKCAGQGACKGQSKCAFSDKNLAVKVVAKKMADKRNGALNSKGNRK